MFESFAWRRMRRSDRAPAEREPRRPPSSRPDTRTAASAAGTAFSRIRYSSDQLVTDCRMTYTCIAAEDRSTVHIASCGASCGAMSWELLKREMALNSLHAPGANAEILYMMSYRDIYVIGRLGICEI